MEMKIKLGDHWIRRVRDCQVAFSESNPVINCYGQCGFARPISRDMSIELTIPQGHEDEKICRFLLDKEFNVLLFVEGGHRIEGPSYFSKPPDIEHASRVDLSEYIDISDPENRKIIKSGSIIEQKDFWEKYWESIPSSIWYLRMQV